MSDMSSLSSCDRFTRLIGHDGIVVDEEDAEATCLVCDHPKVDHPEAGTRALDADRIAELRERAITVSIAQEIARLDPE